MPHATVEAPEGRPEAPEPHPPLRKAPEGSNKRAGFNVRTLREKQNLTQQDLATRSVWTRFELREFESGHGDPNLSTIRRVAAALGVGWLDLFTK